MTVLERITYIQEVWALALPHVAIPPKEVCIRWVVYDDNLIEQAILRSASKFSNKNMYDTFTPDHAYKYTTSTARHLVERQAQAAAELAAAYNQAAPPIPTVDCGVV
jgi:hypothetical protein